jgi:hypothetical protein
MDTFFIRHKSSASGVDNRTRTQMWRERRVFIHFPRDSRSGRQPSGDSRSLDPNNYTGSAKYRLKALNELARNGGYVCAHYPEHSQWLVGFVQPSSSIQLRRGKWKEKPSKRHNGVAIIKTLRLSKHRLVEPANYALLQTVQPRQGTIMRWHKARDLVEALVLRRRPKIAFDLLAGGHQEALCAEFLRRRIATHFGLPQLDCLLCDVGRTMKDLDIFGLATDGRKIFAQVTHDSLEQAMWKLKALQKFKKGGRGHLVLFCDCGKQEHQNSVIIFPIREVYRSFVATPTGKRWLRNIFPTT